MDFIIRHFSRSCTFLCHTFSVSPEFRWKKSHRNQSFLPSSLHMHNTTLHYTKEFELLLGQLFSSSPPMHKSEKQYIPCFSNFLPSPPFAHGETRCQNQKSPAKPCCSQLKDERQTLTLILALPGLIQLATIIFHSLGMAINTTIRSLVQGSECQAFSSPQSIL